MRHSKLHCFRPQMLLSVLLLLASWGTVDAQSPPTSAVAVTDMASSAGSSESPLRFAGRRGITVVLDPGHNGASAPHSEQINRPVPDGRGGTKACNTTGTATDGGYPEHAFNWDVALRVRDALTARGVQVVLTRPDDAGVGPCVNDRAAVANRANATAVVSIHADGAPPAGHGFHVAYSDPPLNGSQGRPSLALAEAVAKSLQRGGFSAADYIGSRGLYPRPDLAGLNFAQIPAALVECANMRNPREAALVATPRGRTRYATAIADGITAWLNLPAEVVRSRRGS
jgi:N-acetylmuramoyl-L-alanine amidase